MKKTIGFGIIGEDHWYWACGCAYGIATNPQTRLVGIAGVNHTLAKKIAEAYKAENYYKDYKKLLDNPEVDAVIITTTTDRHTSVAMEAAESRKDILLGKPVARTLAEADKIIAAAKKNKVKLMCIGTKLSQPEPALKYIKDGTIGKPYAAHASLYAIPPLAAPGQNEPGWFVDSSKVAGGGFIDHAVYLIGRLEEYFNATVSRIYAEMGKYRSKNLQVEDHGIALARFSNDSIATIEATFTAPVKSYNRMHIIGTEGEIELKGSTMRISSRKSQYRDVITTVEQMPPNPALDDTFLNVPVPVPLVDGSFLIGEFTQCILQDKDPVGSGKVARRHLEVCLAAYKSIEIGSPVSIPLTKDVDVASILAKL